MTEEDKERILLNTDFTLISDDFWGGHIYKKFGVQYNSPFIGLNINPKDYLRLLKNIGYYLLENELVFLRISEFNFPVAVLGDILIYFKGYKSAEEADEKWRRRLRRINWDNLFVKMTITDIEDAVEFGKLHYKNKIAFTKEYCKGKYDSCSGGTDYLEESLKDSCKVFDVINWLNTG
jgi:uncharacterized protein (DUF1919 family)